jgi:hypothetical protein
MKKPRVGRRDFLRNIAGSAAAISVLPRAASAEATACTSPDRRRRMSQARCFLAPELVLEAQAQVGRLRFTA